MRQKRMMAALLVAMLLATASCGMGQSAQETGFSGKGEVQEEERDAGEEAVSQDEIESRSVADMGRQETEGQGTVDMGNQETSGVEDADGAEGSQEASKSEDKGAQVMETKGGGAQADGDGESEDPAEPVGDEGTEDEGSNASNLVDGMRPEFKEAMDSYETFYEEYCEFMKQYSENPSDLKLLTKYMDFLTQLADVNEKFEAWDGDALNDAELKYYIEVSGRVTQKLMGASISMQQ